MSLGELPPWGAAGATGQWSRHEDGACRLGNLGVHLLRLYALAERCGTGCCFVDLGVDHGVSSLALALDAIPRSNNVYGVDLRFVHLGFDLDRHPNYHRVLGDSVTVGKQWEGGDIDLLFVDTLHIEPQVLCELYVWYPHVKPGGFVVLHDTAWPDERHDLAWHPDAVRAGLELPTPDRAVASFFGLEREFETGKHSGFRYVDDDIEATHYPESWGMTVVHVKRKQSLAANIADWSTVFAHRSEILRLLLGEQRLQSLGVELELT